MFMNTMKKPPGISDTLLMPPPRPRIINQRNDTLRPQTTHFKAKQTKITNYATKSSSADNPPNKKAKYNETLNENEPDLEVVSSNMKSGMRFLIGTIDRVLKWSKMFEESQMYQVIASVVSIQQGAVSNQEIILLRHKIGPILKVVRYKETLPENIEIKQTLTCIGRMITPTMLHAYKIRVAGEEEVEAFARLHYNCEHEINLLH